MLTCTNLVWWQVGTGARERGDELGELDMISVGCDLPDLVTVSLNQLLEVGHLERSAARQGEGLGVLGVFHWPERPVSRCGASLCMAEIMSRHDFRVGGTGPGSTINVGCIPPAGLQRGRGL